MALSLKLSPRSTLKFKTATKIPARLLGGDGIDVAYANGAYTISIDLAADWSFSGSVSITGTNTTDRGLTITQSSPTSGSIVGPLIYNLIDVTSGNTVTNDGSGAFTPPDPLLSQAHRAFEVRLNVAGGANTSGFQEAGVFQLLHTTADSPNVGNEFIGVVSMVYSNKAVPLSSSGGGLYAINANAFVDDGGSHSTLVGVNTETGVFTGGYADYLVGLRIQKHGDVQGDSVDAAIEVWSEVGASAWQNFVVFGDDGSYGNLSDTQVIDATGDLFRASGAFTVANVFNLPSLTVSSYIFNFPNFTVTGLGVGTFAQSIFAGANQNTASFVRVTNTHAGTGAIASFQPTTDTGVMGNIGAGGSGYTTHPLLQNRIGIHAVTASSGIALVNEGSDPIVFGISDAEVARFDPTLGLKLTSTDAGALNGPDVLLYRNSATPAANDVIGSVTFDGKDGAGNDQNYGRIAGFINDPTSAAETSSLLFQTVVSGANNTRLVVKDGLQTVATGVAPTGGDKGPGTINAAGAIYVNNSALARAADHLGFFAATTSAQLAGVISDETGSGALVFATSPTLVTPALGAATATSINKVALTAPASSATIAIADGTTLTQTTSTSIGRGQYQGTNTNDSATAGNIGEHFLSTVEPGSAVSLTTATDTNITSITFATGGDYWVCGRISFLPASGTTSTLQQASISATSATRSITAQGLANAWNGPSTADVAMSAVLPPIRVSIAAGATRYLVARWTGGVSTMTAYGYIEAWRAR